MPLPAFYLFALMLVSSFQPCWSQPGTQVLKGEVTDKQSRVPLPGVTIQLVTAQDVMPAVSDSEGRFTIHGIAFGRHDLVFSLEGYETLMVREIVIGAGKEVDIAAEMVQAYKKLETVYIRSSRETGAPVNDMVVVSGRSITVDQSRRFAAAVNDPARLAMSFAGVTGADDAKNQIVVRGNSPKGLQWRVEGIEVANPNHFAVEGSTGGGITAISTNLLGTSDFLTGAFPAEYGNATSGVFDLRLRKGNDQRHEQTFQAGVLGIDFAVEGPLSRKARSSYLANYRYSTLDILNRLGLRVQGNEANGFQDLAFKLYFPVDSTSILSVWGIGGLSTTRVRERDFREDFRSDRMIGGMNYVRSLDPGSHIELAGAVSLTSQQGRYENALNGASDQEMTHATVRVSALYEKKLGNGGSLRGGMVWSRLGFGASGKEFQEPGKAIHLDNQGSTHSLQAHLQLKQRVGERLTAMAGLHSFGFRINGEVTLEPRAGLRLDVHENQSLSFGAGIHSRAEPLSTYMAPVQLGDGHIAQPNRDLKLGKSAQLVLGYQVRPSGLLRILAETYYQYHYHIPIGPLGTGNAFLRYHSQMNETEGIVLDSLTSAGTGESYGIELTTERSLSKGFYFMITTSLYRTVYTARDGKARPGRFSGGFAQNLLAGKEWQIGREKRHSIMAGAKLVAAGGNRFVPVNLEESVKLARTVREWEEGYSGRLPAYFRIDWKIGLTRNRRHSSATWSLDVQNTTNRRNALGDRFNPVSGQIEIISQAGLIPVLNYRLEF